MRRAALVVGSFLAMEPVTYAAHRWVMHGPGMAWHRSHHAPPAGRFEANDAFPVVFAGLVMSALAVGYRTGTDRVVGPVAAGVTAYGVAYAGVHDLFVHGRAGTWRWRPRPLEVLAERHGRHHVDGGEPFGMLVPVLGRRRRQEPAAPVPGAVSRR